MNHNKINDEEVAEKEGNARISTKNKESAKIKKAGVIKVEIEFPPSGSLQNPLPTDDQVTAAITSGCAATGLPTPVSITVK